MIRMLILGALALSAAACAKPASVSNMATGPLALQLPPGSPLVNAMCVRSITGGTDTNPLWASTVDDSGFAGALQSSLSANGLAATGGGCTYAVDASLTAISKPLIGISFTITSVVDYGISAEGAAAPAFTTTVTAPYTAEFSDSFLAVERLRLANGGSIRANISAMLRELAVSPIAQPQPADAGGVPSS